MYQDDANPFAATPRLYFTVYRSRSTLFHRKQDGSITSKINLHLLILSKTGRFIKPRKAYFFSHFPLIRYILMDWDWDRLRGSLIDSVLALFTAAKTWTRAINQRPGSLVQRCVCVGAEHDGAPTQILTFRTRPTRWTDRKKLRILSLLHSWRQVNHRTINNDLFFVLFFPWNKLISFVEAALINIFYINNGSYQSNVRTRREFEFQLTAVCLMVHKFFHFNFLVDHIKHFANDVNYSIPKAEAAFIHAFHGDGAAGLDLWCLIAKMLDRQLQRDVNWGERKDVGRVCS